MAGPESSILKIRGTEIQQRITELTVEAVGYYALSRTSARLGSNDFVGPDYALGAGRALLQHAQDLDLRRLERDPAQHHRQGRSRPLRDTHMDFSFTEEQTLLRNSVSNYLADNYTFDAWRKFTRGDAGRDPKHWKQFAELGLLAAPLAGRAWRPGRRRRSTP